jgi:hypothetical protein
MAELIFFAVIACIWWCLSKHIQSKASAFDLRAHFDQQYRQYNIVADDPIYCFDGTKATIIQEREEVAVVNEQLTLVGIERYARNDAGEYFLFIANGQDKLFCKHVSHRMAKFVLKEKYVAPPH